MKSVTSPVCNMGMMSVASQPLSISSRGALVISDNNIDVSSHTAASGPFSVKMLTQTLATNLSSGANVAVMNNKAKMLSVTATLIGTFVTMDTLALNADAASVTIKGNVYDVSGLTVAGFVAAFLRPTNYLTTSGTVVEVSDNVFIRNNVAISSPTQTSIALVGSISNVGIYVHASSSLRIYRNSITDGPTSSDAFTNVRFLVAGGLTQTGGGMINITNNTVVFATTIATLFSLTTDYGKIAVCGNSVNAIPCQPMSGEKYSCGATGAVNVVFVPCSSAVTLTSPHTLSMGPTRTRAMTLSIDPNATTAAPGSAGARTPILVAVLVVVIGCFVMSL